MEVANPARQAAEPRKQQSVVGMTVLVDKDRVQGLGNPVPSLAWLDTVLLMAASGDY